MYISRGLSFCRVSRTSCTMDEFCLLYLLMILLMRSGDIETNPGPHSIVSEKEFLKLSKQIEPSYYKEVGINLDLPIAELGQIEKDSQNTSDALMTVFTRWRDKQPPGTDIRALLVEELERSDLGSLSGELLAGSLALKQTGAPATMPGSQTRPLSPDLIKRCADDFKSKYRTTLCKIRADPLNPDSIVPFNDMYTNLVLEEGYRDRKRPLEYRDLFDLKVNGEFPKRIMIQGEAGAGKTTLCAKIAWDWINNSPVLPKFVWVLVIPLREAKQYTIGEIAKSYLSKDNPATASQITEYIRSNTKDVFIAFDGLDEFSGQVVQQMKAGSKSECLQPQSADQAEARGSSSERGDIALGDILRSDEIATCPVLVTSRPWKVTEIRWDDSLRKLYTFIYVEGFSKTNVEVYIHKYFEEDVATADQLIQLTKDNNIISENMAPYPIYIAMLCLMWRELSDEKQEKFKSFRTFSQIFDEMFEFLKVHYAQKAMTNLGSPSFQAYISQIEKFMEPVAKVAFNGLQKNTLIFKEDDFEQCSDSMETACRVGVLSQEKKFSSRYDKSSSFLQSTIFFPHKLFQEYMAGVHLASLYELDHNEFNRLIEEVVLPRKEEFRHLLYFTVSRDKTIANHVMKCMLQGHTPNRMEMDFLVDVSFESQDLDTAVLVRGGISSLTIRPFMTAHTIAGYVFTGLYKDVIDLGVNGRKFGPCISHDVAEMICSVPSLKSVTLLMASLHSDFYAVLAKEGNKSKVEILTLHDVPCPTSASSHQLVDALCSMPNLTGLTLSGKEFNEEFYSTLNAKTSALKVKTLNLLLSVGCPTSASSHHLVDALCSMPNLTELTLSGNDFQEEFYSTLKAKASTLQVKTLALHEVWCPTSVSAHHLVDALCSMPNLTQLTLSGKDFQEEFYSTLKAKASTLQVQSLVLHDVWCPTSASSHHLLDALCSMPNLTELSLSGKDFQEEFYSTLKAKASALHVRTLALHNVWCPTSVSSHHLVDALCSMPNLTELTLSGKDFQEEIYSTLNAKASTLQVQTVVLVDNKFPTSASVHHLVDALCFMPNLIVLKLGGQDFQDEFYSTLNAKASTLQAQTVHLEDVGCPRLASSHHKIDALCGISSMTNLALSVYNFQEKFYSTLNVKASTLQVQTLNHLLSVGCPTSASSHHLVDALCSMPNLTELSLSGKYFQEKFYSTLRAKASTLQVQTVVLVNTRCPTSASSDHLVEALCSMPNLTVLNLDGQDFKEEFYSTLNVKASTLQVNTLRLLSYWCPTSASSHNRADALCSMPNLTVLELSRHDFQEKFYSTLNAKASTLQVKSLSLHEVWCPTLASSHQLVDALCSMPNLTELTLSGKELKEEIYSTLNAKASTLQVQTVNLVRLGCPTLASSHHLIDALCAMPNLTDLILYGQDFQEEFYSTLNAKASTLRVKSLTLHEVWCATSASSHHLVGALCSMPNLTDLMITGKVLKEEFYSTLNAKASTLKVSTLSLLSFGCPTSASSHHLVDALCSMPNLTELNLGKQDFQEELYSTLNAKASTLHVTTLQLLLVRCTTSASSHHLVDALCSMPNLNELSLRGTYFHEEFYSTLKAKASTLHVQTVVLVDNKCPTSASVHHLVDAFCSMPNLTELTLIGKDFQQDFYTTLKAKASTLEGSFPQVRKGNFKFNGYSQADFDSFVQSLTHYHSEDDIGSVQPSRWYCSII